MRQPEVGPEPDRTWWTCKRLRSGAGLDGRKQVKKPEDAVLISSLTSKGTHAPCLDFDFPGMVTYYSGRWRHYFQFGTHRPFDRLLALLEGAHLINGAHGDIAGGDFDPSLTWIDYIVPVRAVTSSNPYHHHFYIDAEIHWDVYAKILQAMCDVLLLEDAFVKNSVVRRMTMLLKPHFTRDMAEERGIVFEESY